MCGYTRFGMASPFLGTHFYWLGYAFDEGILGHGL
jgi:hypothetical protein